MPAHVHAVDQLTNARFVNEHLTEVLALLDLSLNAYKPRPSSDSLRRHTKLHSPLRTRLKSRKKSCQACVKSKTRCSGERPCCSSCRKRKSSCSYDIAAPDWTPDRLPIQATTPNNSLVHSESAAEYLEDNRIDTLPLDLETTLPVMNRSTFGEIGDPGPLNTVTFDNALPTDSFFADVFQSSTHNEHLAFESLFHRTITGDLLVSNYSTRYTLEQLSGQSGDSFLTSSDSTSVNFGNHNEAADRGRGQSNEPILPVLSPRDSSEPDNPWAMEWCADAAQLESLPALGLSNDHIPPRYFAIEGMSTSTWDNLQKTIRLAIEHGPWAAISLANFPSKEKLDCCIDLYFARFHAAPNTSLKELLSIPHRPTFNTNQAPVVLVLAMVTIGACYSNLERSHQFAIALSELNRRLVWYTAEHDPGFIRTDYYVMAQLLQSIFGSCSGNKRLLELNESSRSNLVNNAACMGLFHATYACHKIGDSSEERWRSWIQEENLCRLGWGVYLYDSSVSFQLNKRPYASLATIHLSLPNSSELWEAESAQAWDALHPSSDLAPSRRLFRPLICSILSDNAQAIIGTITDWEHRRIILSTVSRILWSSKEMAASFTPYFNRGWARKGRDDILGVLNFISQSFRRDISSMTTPRELQYFASQIQILHMSQLYAAGDLMDWLLALLRDGQHYEESKQRMINWALESTSRVRKVAYHSAQVLGIIRKLPYNHPMEPFNAFYAGVILWHMAWILQMSPHSPHAHDAQHNIQVRLDQLNFADEEAFESQDRTLVPHSEAVHTWIWSPETLGSVTVGIHGVPNITSTSGPQQIRQQVAEMLDHMPVWGMAQKFRNAVYRLVKI
ncbi:uncharacterized protein PAC_18233 [Phialocephala subalpina]|uniref:Zn(2)-C6 fungal-type domain-containing protein n=1 Tax=Phialocephala subalpina TaxID=576137 RepID=A0A1L7XTG8_9HELO|nr:uncharacterized protein PAC_18233 [Phialocephala subalpina]